MKAIVNESGEIIAVNINAGFQCPEGCHIEEVATCPVCGGTGYRMASTGQCYNEFNPREEA